MPCKAARVNEPTRSSWIAFDTRDFEPDPTSGVFADGTAELATPALDDEGTNRKGDFQCGDALRRAERFATSHRCLYALTQRSAANRARQRAPLVGGTAEVCYLVDTMPPDERAAPRVAPLASAALEHVDALFRVARHLTGRDGDAEDLVQETFARALGSQSQFAPGTNLRAWLFRILRNCHIDAYRRARRSPVRAAISDDDGPDVATPAHDPLRGDEELDRLRGLVAEDIEAALASLSIDARAVVLLDLEGLTESELALAMDCSVGTIKSRLSRARAVLRKRLSDYSR